MREKIYSHVSLSLPCRDREKAKLMALVTEIYITSIAALNKITNKVAELFYC